MVWIFGFYGSKVELLSQIVIISSKRIRRDRIVGLVRTIGNRVRCKPSRVRIPLSPLLKRSGRFGSKSAFLLIAKREKIMSRFPIIEEDQVIDSKVREIYNQIKAELGFGMVPNIFKSMASNPNFLEANWVHFRGTILKGLLPRTLKEMVGIAISQANDSQYALNVHLHGLSALGMSEEVLRLLVADFANCPLPEREKSVISFGLKAATRPGEMTDGDYQGLREMGLDDREIFEIIATANLFTGVNQYTDSIDLEIDAL